MNARIQANGTVSGPDGSQSRTLDESASTGSITGAVGGYTYKGFQVFLSLQF